MGALEALVQAAAEQGRAMDLLLARWNQKRQRWRWPRWAGRTPIQGIAALQPGDPPQP